MNDIYFFFWRDDKNRINYSRISIKFLIDLSNILERTKNIIESLFFLNQLLLFKFQLKVTNRIQNN